MLSILKIIRESIEEVAQKVSWPSQQKVQESITHFFIGILIFTTTVGIINIGFDRLMQWFYTTCFK